MSVIHLLIPVSLIFAGGFLWAFIWAVRSGQYDDTRTPSLRVLLDEPEGRARKAAKPAGAGKSPEKPISTGNHN